MSKQKKPTATARVTGLQAATPATEQTSELGKTGRRPKGNPNKAK
jgi:hypothetical protein